MVDPISDKQLILRFRKGHEDAFEVLHRRYADYLYTYIRYQVDRQTAEDLFQDIMIKVQKHLVSFDAEGNYHAWLIRIAVNTVHDHRRKMNRMKKFFIRKTDQHTDDDENIVSKARAIDTGDIAHEFVNREISDILKTAIQKLPEDQQEVIHLYYMMDLTFREIAEALECSINTISARARYALKNLKKILGPVLVNELKGS